MRLSDLLPVLERSTVSGDSRCTIHALRYDSRRVERQDVFFAWRGDKTDGHDFIPQAVDRGAAAVVLENADFVGTHPLTYVQVPDARRALARMAAAYHGYPARMLRVIGVTGTNGKTTTTFILKHLLSRAGRKVGLIGTVRYEMGARVAPALRTTPEGSDLQELLAQIKTAGCDTVVMETSSHALDQGRVEGMDYHTGVFTNLTPDHLDYHGTMDRYLEAKTLLFTGLDRVSHTGTAILNVDDPASFGIRARLQSANVLTYSASGAPADWSAQDLRCDTTGAHFTLVAGGRPYPVHLSLLGTFNVANALAAAAAAQAEGLAVEEIVQGLGTAPSVPGRMEDVPVAAPYTVVVDYAHTEDALKKILQALRELQPKRLLVVVGCGGNRDRTKRPLMARAAVEGADQVILTADNPRNESVETILDEMEAGIKGWTNYARCPDRREAIAQALAAAGKGDVVCIAGKGHEMTQEINGIFHPFDDRAMVQDIVASGGRN